MPRIRRQIPNWTPPPPRDGAGGDASRGILDELGESIRGLGAHKRGGADRLQTAIGGARASAGEQVRRAGADPGSLAAMQIASGAETAALSQGVGREAQFQRGIDDDIVRGLSGLAGLEIGRETSREAQALARDRFEFDEDRYEDLQRLSRGGDKDPLRDLQNLLQREAIEHLLRYFQGASRFPSTAAPGGRGGGAGTLDPSQLPGLLGGLF